MHFSIDSRAPSPPSEQLADQVRFAVASGRLGPGDRLPSVRALAAQVEVNPNTVSRAWRELEREGIVAARRGEGVFVTPAAPAACLSQRDRIVVERLGRAVAEASAAGLDGDEVLELVRDALHALHESESEPATEEARDK